MSFLTDGTIGAKIGTPGSTQEFELGKRATGTDGTVWVYVKASEALTQYDFVAIDENFAASQLTGTEADDGWHIGVAQAAFSADDYGWVPICGSNITGRVAASCAADAALYTTATAGVVDDATTGTKIDGAVAVAANTATSTASVEVMLTFPRSATF